MVLIPAGEFVMGSDDPAAPRNERPAFRVKLDAFWMDDHEVTNAEFRRFVEATGYVTTAEKPPDWEEMKKQLSPGTPKPPADKLVPGSMVFLPPTGPVPLHNAAEWWQWVPGACWKRPEGPESNVVGRDDHPVVQISWDDAVAYSHWAGKRLPTEAEWEFAARGMLADKKYIWGDDPPGDSGRLANIWQGDFPYRNLKLDGYERTAPVRSYPPNGYGLYDMAGNVWEWCSDWYHVEAYARVAGTGLVVNPPGPREFLDPREPSVPKRVIRGGSFLCHVSYCEGYRPGARRGIAQDTGMSHIGFRCVQAPAK
jgi:formylglycine-generating enzyme